MPTTTVTDPIILDSTGQSICSAIENLAAAVKPTAAEMDMSSTDSTKVKDAIDSANTAMSIQSQARAKLSNVDILSTSIAPGLYYVTNGTNTPTTGASGYLDVTTRVDTPTSIRTVKWRVYNSYDEYINLLPNTGTWSGWQSIALKSDLVDVSDLHFMRKRSMTATSVTITPSYGRQSFMIVVNKNSTKDRQLWMVGLYNGEMSAVRIDSGTGNVSFSFNASAGTEGTITISSLTTYSIVDVMSSDAFT